MNPNPPHPPACPNCRAPLAAGAPFGLCPSCLLDAAGMESDPGLAADPFAAPLDPATLRRAFPQLDIVAPLGAGGMGRVYRARQLNLDRQVALKILPPEFARDPAWVERFTREARALARLNHPNIVQIFDVGQSAAMPGVPALCWLVMEYVDGVSLRQVQRTGGLSAREALLIIPKLCDALQYAHEKGVLHRDIKPENILLDSGGCVKIADFGLAKLGGPNAAPTLTLTGARLGTAAYMAPEQIESPQDVDHRADIYSLGVVFYELLTGGLPLGRFPAPSEKSGLDPRLDDIVFRTLEKERDRRYQAAGDVRTALESVPPPAAPGSPVPPRPRRAAPADPTIIAPPPVPPVPPITPEPAPAVRFHDRHRPFPRSGAEAAGYGCGWLVRIAFRLALAVLPAFLPVILMELYREWNPGESREPFAAAMLWITGAAAIAAWFAVQPLLRMLPWTQTDRMKRRAPLLLLGALILWCGTLALVSGATPSWPSRGTAARLTLTTHRPPVTDAREITSDEPLDERFRRIVTEELDRETSAIIGGSGFHPIRNIHDGSMYLPGRPDPIPGKTWTLALAGTSRNAVHERLTRIARAMLATLPPDIQATADARIHHDVASIGLSRIPLTNDESLLLAGALVTLGGWLAGMTRGRPWIHSAAPWMLTAAVIALHVHPVPWTPSGLIVPAGKPADPGPANPVLAAIAPGENAGTGSDAAALFRWIDACRRYDRAAAAVLAGRPLTDDAWQRHCLQWMNSDPLIIVRSPGENPSAVDSTAWICVLLPRPSESLNNDSYYHYGIRYYQGPGPSLSQTARVRIIVTKSDSGWKITE